MPGHEQDLGVRAGAAVAEPGVVLKAHGRRRHAGRVQGLARLDPGLEFERVILGRLVVGPGEMVGVDLEKDRERFAISAGGVVAVGKGVWI